MPYTEEQNKLFRAAAHDPEIARSHNLTQMKASELASEGVKTKRKALAAALRKR